MNALSALHVLSRDPHHILDLLTYNITRSRYPKICSLIRRYAPTVYANCVIRDVLCTNGVIIYTKDFEMVTTVRWYDKFNNPTIFKTIESYYCARVLGKIVPPVFGVDLDDPIRNLLDVNLPILRGTRIIRDNDGQIVIYTGWGYFTWSSEPPHELKNLMQGNIIERRGDVFIIDKTIAALVTDDICFGADAKHPAAALTILADTISRRRTIIAAIKVILPQPIAEEVIAELFI